MKAVTETLTTNRHVKELTVEENRLKPEALRAISDMLHVNSDIEVLNLKECRMGPQGKARVEISRSLCVKNCFEGAEQFGDGIDCSFLRELNLSKNDLGVEGMRALSVGLADNSTIKTLNLSRNNLEDTAADVLAEILEKNDSIEYLDPSWNDFSTPRGNINLCYL